MIVAHIDRINLESYEINAQNIDLLQEAVWIDLLSPTSEDNIMIDKALNADIPTSQEMGKIRLSNTLYKQDNNIFMIATMILHSESKDPEIVPVSFVLTPNQLITVRYADPKTFHIFSEQLKTIDPSQRTAPILLIELLHSSINRLADILSIVGEHLEDYSKFIFAPAVRKGPKPDYRKNMRELGYSADLATKARESLLAFSRLIYFLQQNAGNRIDAEHNTYLLTLNKDIQALGAHAEFQSNKINYLLAATLGSVNISQNNTIKIFSVAAVSFLPPTLVASIYGMNFSRDSPFNMPELGWEYGYIYALVLMMLGPFVLFRYFKYRGWF